MEEVLGFDYDDNNPCAERWQNIKTELTAKMWGIFEKTGLFLTLCQHGFVLILADMVYSYYNFSLTSSLTLHLPFTSSFSNLAYLISLIPRHESLIYDLFYLSLTHVHCFDSPWTIIRYDSYVALTHTFNI
jgi:Kyakuja-Dileera-Zisupton transposase